MKGNILNFIALNIHTIGRGLVKMVIKIMVISSMIYLNSCEELVTHCKSGYPLWCSQVEQCCPAGYAYYCDGNCSSSPCSVGTVTVDTCVPG